MQIKDCQAEKVLQVRWLEAEWAIYKLSAEVCCIGLNLGSPLSHF